MKRKIHSSITQRPVSSATGMLLALLAATPAAFAQTTYYRDINGAAVGFGSATGNWDTTSAHWNPNSGGGGATPIAWVNDPEAPNSAILDFVGNTAAPGAVTLITDLNLGGLEVKGLSNSTSGPAGPVLAINASRAITFGANAVVTIEDRDVFLSDLNIRALATTAATTTVDLNGFTKAGAGTLQITAQAQTTAGATTVVNLTGTVNVDAGQLALVTIGTTADTTRSINVGGAVFNLASGTVLSVANPFSYTAAGVIPATGTAAFGEIAGSGTVRGERNGAGNTLTLTATGITPGTVGTIDTLTIADFADTNMLNVAANGSTAFSFDSLAPGGLKFDLGAPGTSDLLAFSSLSKVNLAGLAFSHFDFNQLAGFGAGTYTLVSGLPSLVEGSLGETTGTIDGRTATLAINGSSLELTVGGAGSDTTAPLISVIGSDTSVSWGSGYSDEGATATDPEEGTVAVVTVNPVDTSTPGVYTVTYRATDAAGNSAQATRTVTVSIANPTVPGDDGFSPLIKYAFGATSPSASVQGPVLHSTATTLSLTAVVRTNDPAVIVSAEAVNELTGTWGTGGTVNVSTASDQSDLPPNTQRRVYTVDLTGEPKKFLRLNALLTPAE
jgi:trimeric autotransporter adhesin